MKQKITEEICTCMYFVMRDDKLRARIIAVIKKNTKEKTKQSEPEEPDRRSTFDKRLFPK